MKLPNVDEMARSTPTGGGSIVSYQGPSGAEGAVAKAEIEQGQMFGKMGQMFDIAIKREEYRMDKTAAQSAVNDYQKASIEFTVGDDGYQRIQGGEVAKQKMVKVYGDRLAQKHASIMEGLNPEQQRMFAGASQSVTLNFQGGMLKHAMAQRKVQEELVFNTSVANASDAIIANPSGISAIIGGLESSIQTRGEELGISGDAKVMKAFRRETLSKVYTPLIDNMITTGRDEEARGFFNGVKKDLSPQSINHLEGRLKQGALVGEAMRTVDAAQAKIMGEMKDLNAPYDSQAIDAYLREHYKTNPAGLAAGRQEAAARQGAYQTAQSEYKATNLSAVYSMSNSGKRLSEIKLTPEYSRLTGEEQTRFSNYVNDRGYTMQQRARSEEAYQDSRLDKSKTAFSAYVDLVMNPEKLKAMSQNEVLALQGVMGSSLMKQTVTHWANLQKPMKVAQANIDNDVFKTKMAEYELVPTAKSGSQARVDQDAVFGQVRAKVESEIELAIIKNKGADISREEKAKILDKVMSDQVKVDNGWFRSDTYMPASAVLPKNTGSAYIPLKDVAKKNVTEAINFMTSEGLIPADMTESDAVKKFGERIQRAVAQQKVGGKGTANTDKVLDILNPGAAPHKNGEPKKGYERPQRPTRSVVGTIDYGPSP